MQNSEKQTPLSEDILHKMNAYWQASNYFSIGEKKGMGAKSDRRFA